MTGSKVIMIPEYTDRVYRVLDSNNDEKIDLKEYIQMYSKEKIVFDWYDWLNQDEYFAIDVLSRQNSDSSKTRKSFSQLKNELTSTLDLIQNMKSSPKSLRHHETSVGKKEKNLTFSLKSKQRSKTFGDKSPSDDKISEFRFNKEEEEEEIEVNQHNMNQKNSMFEDDQERQLSSPKDSEGIIFESGDEEKELENRFQKLKKIMDDLELEGKI